MDTLTPHNVRSPNIKSWTASFPGRYQPISFQSYTIQCQLANIKSKDNCYLVCDVVLPGVNLLTCRCLFVLWNVSPYQLLNSKQDML